MTTLAPATLRPPRHASPAAAARARARREQLIHAGLAFCGIVSILTTAGIVFVLLFEAIAFFREVSLWRFLTDREWTPLFADKQFGVMVLASATFLTSLIALVVSLSEDALFAVPQNLRDGAYALGATRLQVATRVVVPAALSGIVASFILAVSRAVGETMIVAIAAGQSPNLTLNPFVPVETMTAYIVQVSLGDTPTGTLEFKTIFAVGMTLFLLTLGLNILSHRLVSRFRERYE
jgi:ABC-type phosphate transport system permease subunit